MRLIIVHGIMDPVGTSGLLGLVPYLRAAGFDCRVPDYGLITAEEARIVNPKFVAWATALVEPGDIWVGHSNGCAIGYEAIKAGAPLSGAVFINAALERAISLPPGLWADIYFNHGDDATVAAEIGRHLGLTDPVWGDMGHAGPAGLAPGVTGIDCGVPADLRMPTVSGHSDIFTPSKLAAWGPYITQRILNHVGAAKSRAPAPITRHCLNAAAWVSPEPIRYIGPAT